jgi:NADH-quinone oxidoreductase subunit L
LFIELFIDMSLTWLIPIFPFLAFIAIALGAHRSRTASHRLATGAVAASFVLAQVVFWQAVLLPVGGGDAAFESVTGWFPIGTGAFEASVWVDPLTAVMLFAVPLVCLLAFVYSVGYVRDDPRYSRFFAYVSLLAAGMLGLVVSGNLLMLFSCWEVVGLCSYLLIGFRVEKESAHRAGLKALLVTKVGDVFLLLGLLVLYSAAGSLQYRDIFDAGTLDALARTGFLGTQFPVATVIGLLIFGGVTVQAAQFPLHTWLPDAVEGPPPASALIQSTTMALAGVYLMARCFPLYKAVGGEAQMVMVAAGAFTALFAALIATAQDDVRHVLAFSTISQLGYAVAALSGGAYVAGVFHPITHTFSKALLVLGAGSIAHAMEHEHHHAHERAEQQEHGPLSPLQGEGVPFDSNDVKNMGGLAQRQPLTYWTFVAGVLSLSGFPLFTTGFWSQERILNAAYEMHRPVVFWILAVVAGLTAFYAARLLCLIFLGRPRSEAAANTHESEQSMTTPLVVLAVFAVCLGWGGVLPDWFYRFVENGHAAEATHFAWQPLAISAVFTLGGLLVGYLVYGWKPLQPGQMDRLEAGMRRAWLGWLYDALRHRFYFDEFYQATFAHGAVGLARACAGFDRKVLDGAVGFVARAGRAASQATSRFDALVVDEVTRRLAWVSQAASQVAGRFDALVVNRAVNLVAWMSRPASEAAGRFDALVVDGAANLVGRAIRALSELSGLFDPRVLDPLADAAGHATRTVSSASGIFDTRVVNGAVEGVGSAVRAGGRFVRPIQTGRVQNYILIAFISVLVLVAMYLTMVYFAWW